MARLLPQQLQDNLEGVILILGPFTVSMRWTRYTQCLRHFCFFSVILSIFPHNRQSKDGMDLIIISICKPKLWTGILCNIYDARWGFALLTFIHVHSLTHTHTQTHTHTHTRSFYEPSIKLVIVWISSTHNGGIRYKYNYSYYIKFN
jgi:hypothetical protein